MLKKVSLRLEPLPIQVEPSFEMPPLAAPQVEAEPHDEEAVFRKGSA
jgi:hypothetical protein